MPAGSPPRPLRTSRLRSVALLAACLLIAPVLAAGAGRAGASGGTALSGGGSVEEAWLTGAAPGDRITLLRNGAAVRNPANPGRPDPLGSLIVRDLDPGAGYSWRDATSGRSSGRFSVLAPGANPAPNSALYTRQALREGLNYITMRDGVRLAATVRYPYGRSCSASSPCPTVVEYSGYDVAAPTDPIPYVLAAFLGRPCNGCGDQHLLPQSSTYVGSVVARFAGFATVSLQMRGTGCSGGAYDLFGYPSDYDAYDAIEIVAHQDWVAFHKVGMVGISYSGLSQFPSAGTDPPGLAAIAPMSPTDDLFSTGFPGGIYNNGFAASWTVQRVDDAKPAAAASHGRIVPLSSKPVAGVGQPWTYYEIDAELSASHGSSSTCLADQALHDESEGLVDLLGARTVSPGTGPGRTPSLFDRRSMSGWAAHIDVPVFVSGALQDDQTGPQWPALLDSVPRSTPLFANIVNGGHIDSADPQIMSRWLEFLDVYVAHKVPSDPGLLADLVLDRFAATAAGTAAEAPLPPLRFTEAKTAGQAQRQFAAVDAAREGAVRQRRRACRRRRPAVDVRGQLHDLAAGGSVHRYYLGADGTLSATVPRRAGSASLVLDPAARPATSLPIGANPWAAHPPWDWTPVPAVDGVGFETAPFSADTTLVGPATLYLWVKSTTPVVDLQVTVAEVRPAASDEEYITSGFLRSSNQVDLPASTHLFTAPSYLGNQARALSSKSYSLVRIPIDPIANTFRAGTELRIVISAPGGDRPLWTFATVDHRQSATVGFGAIAPSALVVDQVPGVAATAALPACGSLRGEPCRTFRLEGNQ